MIVNMIRTPKTPKPELAVQGHPRKRTTSIPSPGARYGKCRVATAKFREI